MLMHDDAVTLFLDIAGTPSTEIELNELFVTEADEFTLVVPYALKADWRVQIANRIQEDSLFGCLSPAATAISDVLARGSYLLTCSMNTSCLQPSTLCDMLTALLTTSTPCTVALRPCPTVMTAFSLQPRATMPPPTSAVISAPIPAPVTPPGPLLIVECATQRSLRPPTMPPPTSAVTSAPILAPVTPPGPLLIVECATQRSLRPPGPASDNAAPPASPLRVDRAYGLQVAPPSLQVPAAPPVLHHQRAPVLAGPAPDPWPRDVPMDIDRDTQHRRPSHFVDALVPSGDDPPSINPPDVDCCPALPAPDLHCRPRGCDEDVSAPRAHPTCSTTPRYPSGIFCRGG
jgi:hypothetical protein